MTALPPVPPHIVRITAPLIFAELWNWCLFGVLLVQTYVYSYNFPEDKKRLKLLVYTVFLIETLQTMLSGADLYYWFAAGYGDMKHVNNPFASPFDIPLIESLVSSMVQSFYAYRIWVLSNKQFRWFCLLILLCSVLNVIEGIAEGTYIHIRGTFVANQTLLKIVISRLSMNTFSDTLIASAMLYYLTKKRKEIDGFFHNSVMVKVIRLTIETNMLTASVGIVALVLIVIRPLEDWFAPPAGILGKLYSNTLLVSLNNRISVRNATGVQVFDGNRDTTLVFTRRTDSSTDITYMENLNQQSPVADNIPCRLSGTV